MLSLFDAAHGELVRFLLILARVSPLMIVAPLWGSSLVPARVRVFLALLVAALLLPAVRTPMPPGVAAAPGALAVAVALELLTGYLIAFAGLALFAGAQLAGQLVDIQIGFGVANVIDPLTSAQVTLIGQLQYLAALWIFILLDGHHLLLRGLTATFAAAPLGQPLADATALAVVTERAGRVLFALAAQIAAPALTALFLANLALGLVSRMLPQMNVFMVGLPANVIVGLLALAASLTMFGTAWRGAMDGLASDMTALAGAMRGARG